MIIFLATKVASLEVFIGIMVLLCVGLLAIKKWRQAIVILSTTIGTLVSIAFLKQIFAVPRPDGGLVETATYAFPSGHAASVLFLGGIILLVIHRYAASVILKYVANVFMALLILSVGYSRLYLQLHTVEQVFAGYLLGLFWVWITYRIAFKNES